MDADRIAHRAPTTSAEYWDEENRLLGEFQWGNITPEALGTFVLDNVGGYAVPRAEWKVFIAGAGTSKDAVALREALGLRADQVFAPDVSDEAVRFQTALGVVSEKVDLLKLHERFVGQFDLVVDAAFTDVFMSDWSGKGGTAMTTVSAMAKSALMNLIAYVKPGGFFLEKSMVQNEEEFYRYVEKASARKDPLTKVRVVQYEYEPLSALGSSELRSMRPKEFGLSNYGRRIFRNYGIDGHVAIWRPLGDASA